MNIKLILAGIVLTLITCLSSLSYFLYEDNKFLKSRVNELSLALDQCKTTVENKEKEKEVADTTLEEVLQERDKLDKSFKEIEGEWSKRKCQLPNNKPVVRLVEGVNNENDIAADLRNVSGLLNQAACLANGDCIAPKSPSE